MAVNILDGDGHEVAVPVAERDGAIVDTLGVRRRIRRGDPLLPGWALVTDDDGEVEDAPARARARAKVRPGPTGGK